MTTRAELFARQWWGPQLQLQVKIGLSISLIKSTPFFLHLPRSDRGSYSQIIEIPKVLGMKSKWPKTSQNIKHYKCVSSLWVLLCSKKKDKNGYIQIKNYVKLKLRLTEEKQTAICEVRQTHFPSINEGLCTRCYAKVEKVLRYRK